MFTGIITDVGRVVDVVPAEAGIRARIASRYLAERIAIGASIACSGVCLTVVEREATDEGGSVFSVDISPETLDRSTLGAWRAGSPVNLERALAIGDELGGHIVTGHIDGFADLIERRDEGEMARFVFRVPDPLKRFIAEKGSVALDGTSLTVNSVSDAEFSVMLIPHTLTVTTWGAARPGDRVNLEVDMMARYVARLQETMAVPSAQG
ncbi:riboflavin synthase [Amorphus orientalis]|uniref:Riboflavin synthase n=1 Tax=Amorphus orientalis TaxID=649198 RepID=A0AAE4ATD2_9HYPH|nr:riboflavin synthase [Amorphus orientalis]MDQ0316047.1 riboflavin synthase [Amorphus orientalis]